MKQAQIIMRMAFAAAVGVFAAVLAVTVTQAQPPAPNGQIAFVAERDGGQDIYLINADGTDERNLTNAEGRDYMPVWSPDGRYLAFVSERDGNAEVYVLEVASGEAINVSRDAAWDQNPSWSPDSERLLFNSTRDERWQMYTVRRDGSDLQRLIDLEGSTYAAQWSPDGEKIAFTWNNGYTSDTTYNAAVLTIIDADGTNLRELTPMDAEFPRVTWSPDSRKIAYNAYDALIPPDSNLDSQWAFIYNLESDSVTPAYVPDMSSYTGETSDVTTPQWSPDGKWLSFAVGEYVGPRLGFATYAMRGDDARLLLPETRGASWSPESQWLVVSSAGTLYLVDPSSGEAEPLTEGTAYAPAWRPAVADGILWERPLGALL